MFDFIGEIIKNTVAAIAAGIIAISGVFGYKQVQPPPVQTPVAQQQVVESSPAASKTASSTASAAAKTEAKPAKPENKETAAEKNIPMTQPTAPSAVQSKPAGQPMDIKPAATVATTTAPAAATTTVSNGVREVDSLPPTIQPDPRTIVGILCYFNSAENSSGGGSRVSIRGSGVFINGEGYILTNKHVVAIPEFLLTGNPDDVQTTDDYMLDRCEVGTLPSGYHLPTPDEIRGFNPTLRVPVLAYTAKPVYVSGTAGLTSKEAFFADFAVLRITGLTKDAPLFGVDSVPLSFPYAKLLPMQKYNLIGNDVITYGFPGDVTAGQRDAFQTMTMTGSVGNLTRVEFGEKAYADVPLILYTSLPITEGRSGSPLFWRGYVIGLTTFYIGENRTESGSVASDAMIKTLRPTGYLGQ